MVGAVKPTGQEGGGRQRPPRPVLETAASTKGQPRWAHGSTGAFSRPRARGAYPCVRNRSPTRRRESGLSRRAGNIASLSPWLKGPDYAYSPRHPRCNRTNCQLLLPFFERCPFYHSKGIGGRSSCRLYKVNLVAFHARRPSSS